MRKIYPIKNSLEKAFPLQQKNRNYIFYVNYLYMKDLKKNSSVKPYHGLGSDVEF